MFKLLPLLLICLVAGCLSSAQPDGRYKHISSTSSRGSIRSSNSYQSVNLSANSQQRSQSLQTNSVTSFEDEDNSSDNNNNDDLDEQDLSTPGTTIATATQKPTKVDVPTAITRLTAAATIRDSTTASASASTTALRLASSIHLPASSSTTTIQHHFLPPETIPLPITISTRPGLRTVIAPETITVHEPTLVKIGEFVQKIPTAVSHQSQTVVHKHARIVTPIVAPAVRTFTSQVLRAYHTPLIFAPQTTVVRSATRAATKYASITGTGSRINAKASALGGATGGASASASIITSANQSAENHNTNNNKKYKY